MNDYVDPHTWTFIDIDGAEFVYDEYMQSYYQVTKSSNEEEISDDDFIKMLQSLDDYTEKEENLTAKKTQEPKFRSIDEPWTPYDGS